MTPDMDIFRATNPQEASLYDRQAGLPLHVPSSVTIVGVGGVGSWVAYFFALTGVKSLVLIDPDRVEESNRNRTPFHVWHVGDYKADALVEVIMECREDCEIETYNKRYEELTAVEKARSDDTELFFDCRDVVSTLDRQTPITGGYDGSEVTLHVKPDYNKVFSANDEEGYRTTP
jgi:tRNA A37 threonylcarbamoyladenosine dehydratase